MNEVVKHNIVHESEVQRQYPRVKVSGFVIFSNNKETRDCELINLSSGGIGFNVNQSIFTIGEELSCRLQIGFAGVEYSISVSVIICHLESDGAYVGARFDGLGQRERSAIQLIINSYISGNTVEPEDMINSTVRDNYVTVRKRKKNDDPGKLGIGAYLGTLMYGLIGLTAFALILLQIYDNYFVDRSVTASIGIKKLTVEMPKAGTFSSLLPLGSTHVKKGQPLGSYKVSALSFLDQEALKDQLLIDNLLDLGGKDFSGTLFSPCDCVINSVDAIDNSQVGRGDILFTLIPDQLKAEVHAKFRFQDASYLKVGKRVQLTVIGENKVMTGTVKDYRMAQSELDSEGTRGVDVWITTDEPIAINLLDRPVQVKINRLDLAESL